MESTLKDDENRAYIAYIEDQGIDISRKDFDDAFRGEWESELAYSEEFFNELYGDLIPDEVNFYIDHDKYRKDLFTSGGIYSIDTGNGKVWIFDV